jgi:sulfoxide reductase heme-binding subunit YedZ
VTARPHSKLEGWPIVGWASLVVAVFVALALARAGSPSEGLHAALRATARTSLLLFVMAFAASPLHALVASPASKWLLRNRRQLGVSFAASHFAHGALIVLAVRTGTIAPRPVALAGGGIAYLFIAAMTATSFDRTARWLGRARWRALHVTGMYILWTLFTLAMIARAPRQPIYGVPLLVLVGLLGARIAVARRRARTSSAPDSSAPESNSP